jgi:protein-S-isoprenylcysteine O-methyltransferase Ste14
MIAKVFDWPPVWLIVFGAVASGLAAISAPLGDALLWPGRALIALGLGLAVWAAVEFRRARTTIVPREEPSALVSGGPYRFSRNPIYVADLVILAGWVLTTGNPVGLVTVGLYFIVLRERFVKPEEAMLRTHLGEAYRAYCMRVRRWI